MNVFTKKIARKLAYLFAAVVIVVALLVAVSRIASPILEEHRAEIESWASTLLQTPITIKRVRVAWYHYQPDITLEHVTLLNKDTKQPNLQIDKVRVFFSIPQSLWQWKMIPSGIMVTGANLNLNQASNGEVTVQGLPEMGGATSGSYQTEAKFNELLGWISLQPTIILNQIDLHYTRFNGQTRYVTLNNLHLENSSTEHHITGDAILRQAIPTEVTVGVEWTGQTLNLNKINANVYLYVSGLSISQWVKGTTWHDWEINNGIVSVKLWGTWADGAWQKIQTTFQAYDLSLYSATDKSLHPINRLSGNVGWKRDGNNVVIAGDDILMDLTTHLWPVTRFYVALTKDANNVWTPKSISLGYLNIKDATQIILASQPFLSNDLLTALKALNLSGDLQDVDVNSTGSSWTDTQHVSLIARVNHLDITPWHQYPGVTNLSGNVKWDGKIGDLSLHSNQTKLNYDSLFTSPITFDELSGDVEWQADQANNLQVTVKSLHAINKDASAILNGSVVMPKNASTNLDLSANFSMQNVSHVARYLPMRIFDADLVKWLREAFLAGEVDSGNAVVRGSLNDFPFDNHNGEFTISAHVKNVILNYAPGWPALMNVMGKINFSGRQMTVDVDHASIHDIEAGTVHAVIPYLGNEKPQILQVQTSDIGTDFEAGLKFVHGSPLEQTIGKMFSDLDVHGPITLKLGLTVPLSNPNNTQVQGDITLNNGQLNLAPWKLMIDSLTGQIHFTENTLSASGIQGQLFDKPIQLNFSTIQKNKNVSIVQANVATNLDMKDLENWLKLPMSPYVRGSADINADINLSLTEPLEIHLRSNLVGATLNLSDQYSKKAEDATKFTADIFVQNGQPIRLQAGYADLVNAALILEKKNDQYNLLSANIRLGQGAASFPKESGLYISGTLNQLNWDAIKSYSSQSGASITKTLPLRDIDIQANQLNILGQTASNARLQVTPHEKHWDVTIASKEATGDLQVPVNITADSSIIAHFQQLHLQSTNGPKTTEPLMDVRTFPSIRFSADDVSYDNITIGQVKFQTEPGKNGLIIQSFKIDSPRMKFEAVGDWSKPKNYYQTHLQGYVSSNNVSELLASLGFDVHNFISSQGSLQYNLTWKDAPYAFSAAGLNGTATLKMKQGRIVEGSQTSGAKMDLGRMLNIFSLQTIPRRLSLDFSDMFQKGYSFDSLKGDFNFENGNVYTSNAGFDGPVAGVDINGRIGLAQKDYDMTLSVTPHVTSSIPVAAAIITANPAIGLAAWAVNNVIGKELSKVATYYYSVQGPWSNPEWNKISVPKKRSA